MTTAERRLQRAVRWTPKADRPRRAAEWHADLADARQQGRDEEVARAAMTMAVKLRLRQTGRTLLGGSGTARAALGWALLLLALGAASVIGSVVLVLTAGLLVATAWALVQAGLPSRWSHRLMLVSGALSVASFSYVWWVAGVRIDAADKGTAEPALAAWGGLGLVGLLFGVMGFIAAAAMAVTHERARGRH